MVPLTTLYGGGGDNWSLHPEALCSFSTPQPTLDLARVYPVHDEHDEQHQHGVEHVNLNLVLKQWPLEAIGELNQTEDGPNENEQDGRVECRHMSLPADIEGTRSRSLVHSPMENGCGEDEHGEECDLDAEANFDYGGA